MRIVAVSALDVLCYPPSSVFPSSIYSFSSVQRGASWFGDAKMVQHARDDGVGKLLDGFHAGIKTGIRRQNHRAREQQQLHVFDVDEAQRRFARDEDQFLPFLQRHVGGAEQHVLAVAVRDAAHRAHRAGDDDHRVRRIRAAGERCVHAFERVRFHAVGQFQSTRQFFGDDLLRVIALHNVDFVLARVRDCRAAAAHTARRWLR